MLAYVWCNDHVNSCLHIDFFIECRPHIRQHNHCTQKVGTFVEQISDFSCVTSSVKQHEKKQNEHFDSRIPTTRVVYKTVVRVFHGLEVPHPPSIISIIRLGDIPV